MANHVQNGAAREGDFLHATPPEVLVWSAHNHDEVLSIPYGDLNSEQRPTGYTQSGGGSGANTAVCLALQEYLVSIMGAVGSDAAGDALVEEMQTQGGLGLDTRWVVRKPGPTGRAVVISSPAGRMMLLLPGANSLYDEADLDKAIKQGAADARWIHLSSSVDDEQLRLQGKLLQHAPASTKVSLSPGDLYANRGMQEEGVATLLRRTNLLVCNAKELTKLTKPTRLTDPWDVSLLDAAQVLFDNFSTLEAVAITLGDGRKVDDQGYIIEPYPDFDYKRPTIQEALVGKVLPILGSVILLRTGVRIDTPIVPLDRPVVDTTGAGDAWTGGLLGARLKGMSWRDAAVVAGIVAAHTLAYAGARDGLPTRDQIAGRLVHIIPYSGN